MTTAYSRLRNLGSLVCRINTKVLPPLMPFCGLHGYQSTFLSLGPPHPSSSPGFRLFTLAALLYAMLTLLFIATRLRANFGRSSYQERWYSQSHLSSVFTAPFSPVIPILIKSTWSVVDCISLGKCKLHEDTNWSCFLKLPWNFSRMKKWPTS